MKKLTTVILAAAAFAFMLAITPVARAMNVDDILQLCNSGFSADRIARIVQATGMDQPLAAADWARLKTDGCGDEVVDALLDVLAPATQAQESEGTAESDNADNVNVYVHSDLGWNGWYGSMFWGPSDPWWGMNVGWYTPSWGWNGYYNNWYWSDPWWGSSFHHHYYGFAYCDPYFYSGHHYTGGYYFGGVHYRQKAMRQAGGGARGYRYASLKSTPSVQNATFTSARVKPYRNGAVVRGMGETGVVAYRKTVATSVVRTGDATLARRKVGMYGRSSTPTNGAVKGNQPTTTTSTYAKRKTTGTAGTGTTTTGVYRGKTRVSQPGSTGGTTSTSGKRRTSGGATSTGNSSGGTSTGTAKPKYQGSSVSTGSAPAGNSSSGGAQARPKGHR